MAKSNFAAGGVIFKPQSDGSVIVEHRGKDVMTFDTDGSVDMELNSDLTGNQTITGTLDVTGATTLAATTADLSAFFSGDVTISAAGATTIGAGTVDNAMLSGSITRANLIQEDSKEYGIPLHSLRAADGNVLGISDTEDSGDHYLTFSSNTWTLYGNSPNSDTQTDVSIFQFQLPPEYVDGEAIGVEIAAQYTADGDTKTLDLEAYKVDKTNGSVGSDLCQTAAQTLTANDDTYNFSVLSAGIVAGDLFNFKVTTVFQDSDGTVGEAQITSIQVKLSIRG